MIAALLLLATATAAPDIDAVAATVRALPATDRDEEAASDRVERATGISRPCPRGPHAAVPGHPWTLGMNLGGWHDALRRVEPFAKDPATRDRVSAMIDALDHFGDASFVSVYHGP